MALSDRRAGALRERVGFQQRGLSDDGWGGPPQQTGPFETKFTADAAITPAGAGDEVMQGARLEGVQPFVITVRYFPGIDDVTGAWQLVDARNEGRVFAIKAITMDAKRQWVELLTVEGALS